MQKPQMAPEPIVLQVFNPTGSVEVSELFASRLRTLDGAVIAELGNQMWESQRTFPYLREIIQRHYPTAKIIPYTEMPFFDERSTLTQLAELADAVKSAGAQAAIIGNAG